MNIDVVIPLYRGRDVIGACIESVIASEGDFSTRILVVDDASPDDAGDWVRSNYQDVRVVENSSNMGYSHSVNRGLKECNGEMIFLLNQDTVLESDTIKVLSAKLEERRNIVAVAPRLLNPDRTIQRSCRRFPTHLDVIWHHLLLSRLFPQSRLFAQWKMGWFNHDSEITVEQPYFSAILFRNSVLDTVGLLDERFRLFFNDVDYCRRISDSGGSILFTTDTSVIHQLGQSTSQIPFRKVIESHSAFARYFFKHYPGIHHLLPNLFVTGLLTMSGLLRLIWTAITYPITSREPSS